MYMKRLLIGALVGGILLFLWQFLSWSVLGIHSNMQSYSPNQEKVLESLGENLEQGFYFMPSLAPGQDREELMKTQGGKPWAQVYYHKAMNVNMGAYMGRGLLVDIIAILLLAWLLSKIPGIDMKDTIIASLSVGIISYLVTVYTFSIWFETHTLGDLIDAIVSFGLVGVWLGWWLNRK